MVASLYRAGRCRIGERHSVRTTGTSGPFAKGFSSLRLSNEPEGGDLPPVVRSPLLPPLSDRLWMESILTKTLELFARQLGAALGSQSKPPSDAQI